MIRAAVSSNRLWLGASAAAVLLLFLWVSVPYSDSGTSSLRRVVQFQSDEERCDEAAGNSTLGFSSIQYLNLPHRTDRNDAMVLQGYVTGLDLNLFPGVYADDIKENGLPPMSKKASDKPTVIACWRAHANVCPSILLPYFSAPVFLALRLCLSPPFCWACADFRLPARRSGRTKCRTGCPPSSSWSPTPRGS